MRYSKITVLAAILLATLALSAVAGCAPAPAPTPTPQPTATPNLNATATAQAQANATAQQQSTAAAQAAMTTTSQSQAAATAQARANASATTQAQASATLQSIQATVNALTQKATKAFGPNEGTLEIPPQQLRIASLATNLNLRNFIADVQYFNPADPAVHPWDYGFVFRITGPRVANIALVQSDGTWSVLVTTGKTLPDGRNESKELGGGKLTKVDVSATGSNRMRLVVNDTAGYLFVNGDYVATVDLSENNAAGGLNISSGNRLVNMFPGMSTRYKDFIVSSLQ